MYLSYLIPSYCLMIYHLNKCKWGVINMDDHSSIKLFFSLKRQHQTMEHGSKSLTLMTYRLNTHDLNSFRDFVVSRLCFPVHAGWRHQIETFPRYWPFMRGMHRLRMDSPHKGQWCGGLMFCLMCAWTNDGANNPVASDLGRHLANRDVIVMGKVYRSCC